MTDEVNPPAKRPNANYKLSKPDNAENINGEEKLTFYYNRERRLAKAPQSVRDLYASEKTPGGFNLLRPLVADKPRAVLFFTILIICAAIFVLSILGKFDSSYLLDGNKIEIRGTVYEGTAIVMLRKTAANERNTPYSGAVDIAVSPAVQAGEEFPVFFHRVYFSLEPVEEYRFAVPFDSPELLMVIQTERSILKIKLKLK